MTTFATNIAAIPYNPGAQAATGLFAPIMRAAGHILYAMAAVADTGYTIPDDEVRRELEHAAGHLTTTIGAADIAPISANAKLYISHFCGAVLCAGLEWAEWTEDQRGQNLKDLANRAAAIAAFCDLELAGVRGSDPGRSL
jgi:hypothetical protein